jgi:signal transduction histidine kinase
VNPAVRDRRAWAIDWAIAVGFTIAVMLITAKIQDGDEHARALNWLGYTCIASAGLPLGLRRRSPLAVLAVTTVAVLVYTGFDFSGGPGYLGPIIAMYTVGATYPRWRWAFYVGFAAGCISTAGIFNAEEAGVAWFHLVYFTWGIAAGFVGDAARSRREYLLGLEERARSLEESREEESRRLVAEERLRIARDLHDVVAHSLASINIQAGAGAYVAAAHPEQAAEALGAIKSASKEALDELRQTLGVLRSGTEAEAAPRAPHTTPSLARLDDLVARTTRAGVPVEVVVAGSAVLPAAVDAAAYRIVQESLTNVLRHAGPAARVTVRLTYGRDALEIDVEDDGLGSTALNDTPGHGLAGMRERAAGLGGSLTAGAVAGGGFRVRAVLPTRAEVSS